MNSSRVFPLHNAEESRGASKGRSALRTNSIAKGFNRTDSILAERREESRGFPMAVRDQVDQPFANRRPASQARHAGFESASGVGRRPGAFIRPSQR